MLFRREPGCVLPVLTCGHKIQNENVVFVVVHPIRDFSNLFFFFSGRYPLYRRHKDIFAFIGADLIFWATKAFTCWEQWTTGSAWFGAVRSDNRTCHRKVNPSLKKRLLIVHFYVFFFTYFPSYATVKGKILRFYCAHDFVHRDDQEFWVLNSKSRGRDWAKRTSTAILIVGQDSAFLSQSV